MEGIIDVYGVKHGIGTSTFATQLVGFIQRAGYSACLIDLTTDIESGGYTKNNVDIYGEIDLAKMVDERKSKYDFVICDRGTSDKDPMHPLSVQVVVSGVKPKEVEAEKKYREIEWVNNAIFVYNHVPNYKYENGMLVMPQMTSKYEIENQHNAQIEDFYQEVMDEVSERLEKLAEA